MGRLAVERLASRGDEKLYACLECCTALATSAHCVSKVGFLSCVCVARAKRDVGRVGGGVTPMRARERFASAAQAQFSAPGKPEGLIPTFQRQ